ncbi:MAG: DUF6273 domain-containing protein [Lachnospiraceae bacterium]|nr:DUF6273 domain-containing protein [Lachnospiraceae bacterium]
MKKKKIIIILVIVILIAAVVGFCVYRFVFQNKNETVSTPGHEITKEELPAEEEINYVEPASAQVGDKVSFGNYEDQEICWDVIDVQDGKILLMSTKLIYQSPYHNKYENVSWETCDIRKWLNDTFYNASFSDEEKEKIIETKLKNKPNDMFGTKGGKPTKDNVFLLSLGEIDEYFVERGSLMAFTRDGTCVWWWLRSPGFKKNCAAIIGDYGATVKPGHKVFDESVKTGGIRPAMWISVE